jgi:hypothetical protein
MQSLTDFKLFSMKVAFAVCSLVTVIVETVFSISWIIVDIKSAQFKNPVNG